MKLLNKKEFDALPVLEKRIAICKDVLARLKANLIKPYLGDVWEFDVETLDQLKSTPQEFMNENECSVCAKGGLMCSWVGNFNKMSWDDAVILNADMNYKGGYPSELVDVFGHELLDNLEAAFEGMCFSWHRYWRVSGEYAYAFEGQRSMENLMQYIIDNGGEFPLPYFEEDSD